MKNEIVVVFDGYFEKLDSSILLQKEIDIDFNGELMIRFINEEQVLTAVNGVDGWGNNIKEKVERKKAELFFSK